MIKNTALICMILLLPMLGTSTYGQTDPTTMDYTEVDRFVNSLSGRGYTHSRELTDVLTLDFDSEAEKTRAIFKWVAEYISYDCDAERKSEKLKEKDRKKQKEWLLERERDYLPRVLNQRKGAFADHALFFKALCDSAGITSRLIPGFARNDETRLGRRPPRRPNHTWNAVRLNEEWYLVDVTWAAGKARCDEGGFKKNFGGHYFLTPPSRFVMNHLPEQDGWQLIDEAYDRVNVDSFFLTPQVWDGYFQNKIDKIEPFIGNMEIPKDTIILFNFSSEEQLDSITVYRTYKKDDEYTTEEYETALLTQDGNEYTYSFSPPQKGRRFFLTFAIKGRDTATYKIIVNTSL